MFVFGVQSALASIVCGEVRCSDCWGRVPIVVLFTPDTEDPSAWILEFWILDAFLTKMMAVKCICVTEEYPLSYSYLVTYFLLGVGQEDEPKLCVEIVHHLVELPAQLESKPRAMEGERDFVKLLVVAPGAVVFRVEEWDIAELDDLVMKVMRHPVENAVPDFLKVVTEVVAAERPSCALVKRASVSFPMNTPQTLASPTQ